MLVLLTVFIVDRTCINIQPNFKSIRLLEVTKMNL